MPTEGDDVAALPTPTTIDVPPHPRLLSILGDIEFQPWQCIAELIDNAFDDFLRHKDRTPDVLIVDGLEVREVATVSVSLPGRTSTPRDGEVWVRDNGTGMGLEELTDALRAGWTSNDRYGHLGLFGVGFNIATARLGHVAVVRTTRVDDPVWQVVTIDLRAMAAGSDFRLPVTTEPKSTLGEHGTEVIIRELKPEHHDTLSRQQARIKRTLGEIYSYILSQQDINLLVDGEAVKPQRHCVWDQSRFVVRNGERIPAVIPIDEPLADRIACLDCGAWQDGTGDAICSECHSPNLRVQERRIWGWVGIQRYLHPTEYGIDFIRNGRKILLRDDSMFRWDDPDDPGTRGEPEYPMEVPRAGRIVGEIHVDHVRVNYQKNAFEYDTPDWKRVVRVLRGEGPLLPKRARDLGYTTKNTSPLARLVAGYRRNDPGLNYLIPGDGKNALHERAREWGERFRKGDPAYQTDEKWYEAARLHDEPPVVPDDPTPPDGDILVSKGLVLLPPPFASPGPGPHPVPPAETEDERRARWRAAALPLTDLDGKFGLRGEGAALDVRAWLVHGQTVTNADRVGVPVYVAAGRGSSVEVFIDGDHKVFTDFAVDTRDLVVVELAEYLRVRNRSIRPLSSLFYDLKEQCLPDHKIAGPFITDHATRLLSRVREAMQPVVAGNSSGYWSLVAPDDQAATERRFALEGGYASWDDLLATGGWVDFAPGAALVRLVSARPEAFLDGRVFRSAHQSLSDPEARKVAVERIVDLLGDVSVLAERQVRRSPEELQRGRLSCRIIELELASGTDEQAQP